MFSPTRSISGIDMRIGGHYVPAREFNVGWNEWDALKTRVYLAWLVFTGKADALSYDEKEQI